MNLINKIKTREIYGKNFKLPWRISIDLTLDELQYFEDKLMIDKPTEKEINDIMKKVKSNKSSIL